MIAGPRLADTIAFGRNLLCTRQYGLNLSQAERYLLWFDALHSAIDDLAFAFDVAVVKRVALRFADAL